MPKRKTAHDNGDTSIAPGWKSRIVGHGEEDPEQLLANPRNWRVHPKQQQEVLAGVLDAVGWVQQVVVNQRTGYVVDGHLRVGLAISRGERSLPVTYVDLDEDEEALVLATFDPIGGMAERDNQALNALIERVSSEGAVAELLNSLATPPPSPSQPSADPQPSAAPAGSGRKVVEITCPECGVDFAVPVP